ncbi:3-isopropylmalate dehydratase large subunit [Asticcacaulis sp. 201]|uniref:3-isopropylmalate dehydratase large subunit n=1 Tax=Asticcacaulis sp. 201 TaxID=3028787 RepID=UPI002916928F|nr:3-isopropylmalate dehydratase large subunit [Asticcacaulis sp. 201]MDV6332329.1 3-isopropylmalate dehydratase large subunit [Asticcacaulis sp. 201]
MTAKSLFEKVWDAHVVEPEGATSPAVLYIDLHLVHEVTSPQAFSELEARGLKVRRPDRTFATLDHSIPTLRPDAQGNRPYVTEQAKKQVETLERNAANNGVRLFGYDAENRGVVHVIGPEMGLTQPGYTVVCGDSHTSTHGAFGCIAFGIGTSEVGHVLATQCLAQRKPKTMRITIDGKLKPGVTGKDVALTVIATLGFSGGTGYALEYAGEVIRDLDMEGRMTVCNLSIEAGARCGMIAPDQKTVDWLRGREYVPQGEAYETAAQQWLALKSDDGAVFDKEIRIDGSAIEPMATWGTSPDQGAPIVKGVPVATNEDQERALKYMGLHGGDSRDVAKVDVVFIGSCTNGRMADLRAAAEIFKGRHVAEGVRALVVPGSEWVRIEAEKEGLDKIFTDAGAEWRLPGCSMCIAMNGDFVLPGQLAVSTSNRNFEGRQGPGSRTVLASPATAAASAIAGHVADPRQFMALESA